MPENPQIAAALGAAIIARETCRGESMIVAGIDIGSRSAKAVILKNRGNIILGYQRHRRGEYQDRLSSYR